MLRLLLIQRFKTTMIFLIIQSLIVIFVAFPSMLFFTFFTNFDNYDNCSATFNFFFLIICKSYEFLIGMLWWPAF